jgi:hypothetical protein
MSKRKITIEIEVETMSSWDVDYTPEFTSKLQLKINEVIQKETKRWNRWNGIKMLLSVSTNKNETL